MRSPSTLIAGVVLSVFVALSARGQAVEVDPALPSYKAIQGVTGEIKSLGSETMNNEMTSWVEGFKTFYPNVTPAIVGKGSGEAPTALIQGTALFGPMSRP